MVTTTITTVCYICGVPIVCQYVSRTVFLVVSVTVLNLVCLFPCSYCIKEDTRFSS